MQGGSALCYKKERMKKERGQKHSRQYSVVSQRICRNTDGEKFASPAALVSPLASARPRPGSPLAPARLSPRLAPRLGSLPRPGSPVLFSAGACIIFCVIFGGFAPRFTPFSPTDRAGEHRRALFLRLRQVSGKILIFFAFFSPGGVQSRFCVL